MTAAAPLGANGRRPPRVEPAGRQPGPIPPNVEVGLRTTNSPLGANGRRLPRVESAGRQPGPIPPNVEVGSQTTYASKPFADIASISAVKPDIEVETVMPDELDTKIALSEARTDVKFAQLIGKIDSGITEIRGELRTMTAHLDGTVSSLNTRLDGMPTGLNTRLDQAKTFADYRFGVLEKFTSGIKTTVIVTGVSTALGVLAIVVGILSYGQQWFGIGVSTRDLIRATISEVQAQAHSQGPPPSPAPTAPPAK
jgi:hypothetical protein